MPIAILYRKELKEYDFGPGHPFRGDRYEIFPRFLKENLSEDDNYRTLEAEPASDEDLLRICQRDYIDFTKQYYQAANLGLSHNGRFYQYHSGDNRPRGRSGKLEEAARLIVGQAKQAADLVQSGEFEKVISIGGGMHHAKRDYGEGFCIYNDVAFASIYLMEKHGLERILILDTDAHAGNGTSEYFYSNPRVLFIDLHQDPITIYPGTGFASDIGSGEGVGFTINVPMPVDAGYDSYQLVFDEIIEPLAGEFKPQIIIRNGGSDPHSNDGLTRLGLPVRGFRMIGERVRKMAETCQGKLIDLIASGYNETVLPYAWLALLSGLADLPVFPEEPEPVPQRFRNDLCLEETKKVVAQVRNNVKEYWPCL
ncbi:histone deacetylase family protein [Chloroflexota bacterium]